MPPIPLHIEDPITPSKASGVTPATQADVAAGGAAIPSNNNASTTSTTPTTTTTSSGYPAARPGAVASLPAPTSSVPKPQPQPTRTYVPADQSGLPPAPQPGAAPTPNATAFQANATGIPPPASAITYMPPQSQMSTPTWNQAPTHSTDTTAATTTAAAAAAARGYGSGPTTINLGPAGGGPAAAPSPAVASPPGYQQNVYAQELNSQQRASLDMQEAREKRESGAFGSLSTPQTAEAAENAWETVKSWGSSIGEAAVKVHGEVWKRIDGKP